VPEEKVEIPKTKEQLRREKWANFWYYYKIPLFVVIFFLSVVIVACEPWAKKEAPDYRVLVASGFILSDDNLSDIEDAFALYGEDLNGDGQVVVSATSYLIQRQVEDYEEAQALDVYMTKLLTDVSINRGYIFLCDELCTEWLGVTEELFCNMDGSFDLIDWDDKHLQQSDYAVNWREFEPFAKSKMANTLDNLDFYVSFRSQTGTVEDDLDNYEQSKALIDRMLRNDPVDPQACADWIAAQQAAVAD